MISIQILPPNLVLHQLGKRAQARRLVENLSRKTLATRSGVPDGTIKRFELTGRIGVESMLALAIALDCSDEFALLFGARPIRSIGEVTTRTRARGRK
jgi:transcriptional regulator with XRE-family HTH domain